MRSEKCIILGNGPSRKNIEMPKNIRTYGCNAIYRDMRVSDLLACDPAMQHEIYSSGYVRDNVCWFSFLNPTHESMYDILLTSFNIEDIIQNKKTSEYFVMAGSGDKMYITWLYPDDKVSVLSLPRYISSGSMAISLAIRHEYKQLYLLGFDGDPTINCYKGTQNYENEINPHNTWSLEHTMLYNQNKNITFNRVNCGMERTDCENVNYITIEEFQNDCKSI